MDGDTLMTSTHTVLQQIDVSWEFPVVFTHAVFDAANPVLVTPVALFATGVDGGPAAVVTGMVPEFPLVPSALYDRTR